MNNKTNPNFQRVSMFYGRARRLALARTIAIAVASLVAVALLIYFLFINNRAEEGNVKFSYLKKYFHSIGYICEPIQNNGNGCTYSENGNKKNFVRYDDGFEYTIKTRSYTLHMLHRLEEEDFIQFKTTNEAFGGYKNFEYLCEFDTDVLSEIGECTTEDGEVLDVQSYLGVIEQAQADLENIIEASGYYRDDLVNDYEWNIKS